MINCSGFVVKSSYIGTAIILRLSEEPNKRAATSIAGT
jgi:hypothetical protein